MNRFLLVEDDVPDLDQSVYYCKKGVSSNYQLNLKMEEIPLLRSQLILSNKCMSQQGKQ